RPLVPEVRLAPVRPLAGRPAPARRAGFAAAGGPAGMRGLVDLAAPGGHAGTATHGRGISSPVRPSSSRPPPFGVAPPHCLKKKATPFERARLRRFWTHATDCPEDGTRRRSSGPPDSPPTISQSNSSSLSNSSSRLHLHCGQTVLLAA